MTRTNHTDECKKAKGPLRCICSIDEYANARKANQMRIKDLQKESHDRAKRKGFYNIPPSDAERLCLIHSEVSEALECIRDDEMVTTVGKNKPGKPEGLPSELADIMIRVAAFAESKGIDLESEIRLKSDYNETRPIGHGRVRL